MLQRGRSLGIQRAGFFRSGGLRTNLLAFWRLDETSGTRFDQSIRARHLSELASPVDFTAGVITNAARITPDNYLGRSQPLFLRPPFAFSLWFNIEEADGDQFLFVQGDTSPQSVLRLVAEQGVEANNLLFNASISQGTWFHVLWNCHASGKNELFLNGTSIGTGVASNTINAPTRFNLGRAFASGTQAFNGSLDLIGAWNRTLTAKEVARLYNSGAGFDPTA